MKIQPLPDPREERELAQQLNQALRPLDETPPPSLAPDQIAAWLEEETAGMKKGRHMRRWAPLLAGCAALLLLLLPLSLVYPRTKNALDSSPAASEPLRGDLSCTPETSAGGDINGSEQTGEADQSTRPDGSIIPPQNGQPSSPQPTGSGMESEVLSRPQQIASDEALKLQAEGILLVDVRSSDSFRLFHLQGAVNIPLERLSQDIAAYLPTGEKEIVYCSSGECSAQAAGLLSRMGYTAYDLGSVESWPLETGAGVE